MEKVDTLNVVEWQEQHKEDNLESGNDDLTGSLGHATDKSSSTSVA